MSTPNLGKDKREAQGDATRTALLTAAREMFGESGYAATSIEDVAARAGVTKGAVYHHFGGKATLFQEVYEQVMHEVSDRVVSVFLDPDHWRAVTEGCQLMIDSQLDPAVRRIALHDARSVLSWDVVHLIESRYGAVGIRGALRKALEIFDRAGLNLSRIESRPAPGRRWEYVFLTDLEGHREDEAVTGALTELEGICSTVRVLGSYPRAT